MPLRVMSSVLPASRQTSQPFFMPWKHSCVKGTYNRPLLNTGIPVTSYDVLSCL